MFFRRGIKDKLYGTIIIKYFFYLELKLLYVEEKKTEESDKN